MKTCSKCVVEKELGDFSKAKNRKDGLQSYCKTCQQDHNRKYRQETKEAKSEYDRKYNQENKESIADYHRKYNQTPTGREKKRAFNAKRNAIKANLEGHFTAEQFIELCELSDNVCACCGKTRKLAADHIVPITWKNSNNFIWNIQPLCKSCNSSKNNFHDTDYRTEEIILWAEEQDGGID